MKGRASGQRSYAHCAVKLQIKDTLKELPTKDKLKVLMYTHSIENHFRKRTASLQRTKQLVPKVSFVKRFHCSAVPLL